MRDVVDNNGVVQKHQAFSAFGQKTLDTDPALKENYGFSGGFTDEETGKINHWRRWHDPATGTWMSPDPKGFAGGDANLSRYVINQPTRFIDPRGTDWQIPSAELGDYLNGALGNYGIHLMWMDGGNGTLLLRAQAGDQARLLELLKNPNLTVGQRNFIRALFSREYNVVILPGQDIREGGPDVCGRTAGRIAKDVIWNFVVAGAEIGLTLGDTALTPARWAGYNIPKGSALFQYYEQVHRKGGAAEQIFWIEFFGNIGSFGLLSIFESIGVAWNSGFTETGGLEMAPAQLFYLIFLWRISYKFRQEGAPGTTRQGPTSNCLPRPKSFEDIVKNPGSLYGLTVEEVEAILGEGWTKGSYGITGKGWSFRKGDKMVFYHEGGRHVGPYWGFTSGATAGWP